MNLIYFFFYILLGVQANDTADLVITIENINHIKGSIEIGLFNTGERFMEKNQAYKSYSVQVTKETETLVISGLPKGKYAISLYHDKNADGICNRNIFGIPKEPYAFSNNVQPKLSAPTFEDCKFNLTQDHSLTIKLIH